MLHTTERFSPLLVPSRSVFIIYITPKHLFHHWTNYECDVRGSCALKKGFHPSRSIPPRPHYLYYPEALFPALTQSLMWCLGVLRTAKRFSPRPVLSRSVSVIISMIRKHFSQHQTNHQCAVHGSCTLKKGFRPPVPSHPVSSALSLLSRNTSPSINPVINVMFRDLAHC